MKLDRLKKILPEGVRPQLVELWRDFQEFTAGGTMTQFLADLYERQFIDEKTYRLALMEAEDTITISGAEDLMGGRTLDHERLGLLGKGGMGEVFVARDLSLQRNVAVKQLYPNMMKRTDLVKRFFTEVQITAQLEHPGIPPVHALKTDEQGVPSYTMKLVRGRTLKQYIKDSIQQLPTPDDEHTLEARLDVFTRVCDTLAYAHARGIIHRDVKPDNIMVGTFGQVMVMDWGVARILDAEDPVLETMTGSVVDTAERERLTQFGETIGTPAYMAPEQAQGKNDELTGAADQYALALILYELTTLRRARSYGKNTLIRVASGIPEEFHTGDKAKGVPREIGAIIRKATRPEPARRYEDVEELADDVRRYLRNEEVTAAPDGMVQKLTRAISKHRTAALAAILGLALLVVLVGVGMMITGAAALESQRRAAAHREQQLADVGHVADTQARLMSSAMHSYREQLMGIAHAAEIALSHPAEPVEYFAEDAWASRETAPTDLAMSRIYNQPVSVQHTDISVAAGVDEESVQQSIYRIMQIEPILQRAQLASAGPDAPFADAATQHALVSEKGVPLVWAYAATEDGVMISAPGSGSLDDPEYDSRKMTWYTDVRGKREIMCDNAGVDESGLGMLVTCMAPLWNTADAFVGVAAVDVTFDYFIDNFLDPPGLEAVAEGMLVDSDGNVQIRSSQKGKAREATEFELQKFEHADQLAKRESGHVEVDGTLVVWRPIGGADWTYVVVGPADKLLE